VVSSNDRNKPLYLEVEKRKPGKGYRFKAGFDRMYLLQFDPDDTYHMRGAYAGLREALKERYGDHYKGHDIIATGSSDGHFWIQGSLILKGRFHRQAPKA